MFKSLSSHSEMRRHVSWESNASVAAEGTLDQTNAFSYNYPVQKDYYLISVGLVSS